MSRINGVLVGAIVAAQGASAFADLITVDPTVPRPAIAQVDVAPASGFDAALAGDIIHPSDLLDYADTLGLATALMGDARDDVLNALAGPGGMERRGDVLVGNTCAADDCRALQVLIVVDPTERRVFLAWQGAATPEVLRPSEHNWPIEGQDFLVGWRNAK